MRIHFQTFHKIETPEQYGDLLAGIIDCIHGAFGHSMPEDETLSVLKSEFVIVASDEDSGQVIAFASMRQVPAARSIKGADSDEMAISLQGAVVQRDYQGRGLYRELNRRRIAYTIEKRCAYIITATQNPRVEHGILRALEESIETDGLESYSLTRHFKEGLYGRQLSRFDYPREDTIYADLNIERGDAFFLTFKLEYP